MDGITSSFSASTNGSTLNRSGCMGLTVGICNGDYAGIQMRWSRMRINKRLLALCHLSAVEFQDTVGTFDNEAKSEYAIELEQPCYGYRYEGYKFYNAPVENYLGSNPEDIRKYVQQDYEQMKRYQLGEFDYVGVKAIAEVQLEPNGPIQRITSGGLWGIESDSKDYLKEVADEQLSELRDQLRAIGFSNRAIRAAMRDLRREEN